MAVDGDVMNKFSKELIESLTKACEHAEGKSDAAPARVIEIGEALPVDRQKAAAFAPRPHRRV